MRLLIHAYIDYDIRALWFELHYTIIIQTPLQGSYPKIPILTATSMCAVIYKIISPSSNKLSIRTLFWISSTDFKRDANICRQMQLSESCWWISNPTNDGNFQRILDVHC